MMKNVLKTLSLFAIVLTASATSHAQEQNALLKVGADAARPDAVCSSRLDVERGWESQRQLLEARLAAKATEALEVKGAIIATPFPNFAPYRTDLPSPVANEAPAKGSRASGSSSGNRSGSMEKR